MNNLWILVIGMAVVTYIPRMVPMVVLSEIELPPFMKRFLEFIPVAVLSSLIFPGILFSTDSMGSAISGGIISIIMAYFEINLLLVVISGILGVLGWQLFI
mgnify:FL=1